MYVFTTFDKNAHFGKKACRFPTQSACGKPVQSHTGLGDTSAYIKNDIYINEYLFIDPVGIRGSVILPLLLSLLRQIVPHILSVCV